MTPIPDDPKWQRAEIDRLRADKAAAYLERNQVVAALARIFPSGVARTAIEGWNPEWHGCVYIDTPAGQLSWHFHDSHAHLFEALPPYVGEWDGHDTPEKYRRLAAVDTKALVAAALAEAVERELEELAIEFGCDRNTVRKVQWGVSLGGAQWRSLARAIRDHARSVRARTQEGGDAT